MTKRFGDFTAVDRITFTIFPGECFGFLGPTGAGKTSTIRMLYGFYPLSDGRLEIFGRDVHRYLREIKYKIGVCQQDNNLDPDLSVRENLLVFARYFDLSREGAEKRAGELLDFFGLTHKQNARIAELSGGLQRRLVVARALINDPTLLVLDEPTTGLDPQSRHQLWDKLRQLKARGLCILLTTHYMDEAAQMCDRLMIIDQGRILVEGAPRDLVRRYIGGNVIEVEEPGEELPEFLKGEGIGFETEANRLLIYTADGEALFPRISQKDCAAGCTLRQATLEDVFLKLTGRGLRE
ncbi:MAG: ATP-binding cassette domain-containing protein [Deltaproteobacteria bacterium]|nr:ATP-binding cassette domain-containing protein [Deltaproteobacteria bacterium]